MVLARLSGKTTALFNYGHRHYNTIGLKRTGLGRFWSPFLGFNFQLHLIY